eukprot:1070668-Prorocentrum_minimum.AAC.1
MPQGGEQGIFSRRTNRTQKAWVYSHNGPIGRRKRGYILITDQSDAVTSPTRRVTTGIECEAENVNARPSY